MAEPRPDVRESQTVKRVPRVDAMMSRRFAQVHPETPIAEVARLLLKQRVAGAAVVDHAGGFVGLVSAQGVLAAFMKVLHDEAPVGPTRRHLDPETPLLHEDTPLLDVLEAFVSNGRVLHALPVLRGRGIVGIVTRLDAVRAALDYFGGVSEQGPGTLYMSALKGEQEPSPY